MLDSAIELLIELLTRMSIRGFLESAFCDSNCSENRYIIPFMVVAVGLISALIIRFVVKRFKRK